MDVEQLKDEVRAGRVGVDRLIELIASQQRQLQQALARIAELEKQLGQQKGSSSDKVAEPFSVRAEQQRQERQGKRRRKRNKPQRRGRVSTAEKVAQAERTEQVYPPDVPREDCWLSHTRAVWRLENGRAVRVAYEVYRGPKNQYGQIPGVIGRGEFGIEVIIAIAYQVYQVGLSFDKVCLLMNFFQNMKLKKSQVDSLLNQLWRHWEGEFETLCTLLAHSAVVHADETSWSINSVWAFLSEKVRVLFFGVHKDAATLETILDPETFSGTVISDDAAVYANFSSSQKCWAHLLRKAIKLTLTEPDNEEYRRFLDRLLEIYYEACRVKRDRRLSDAGRAQKVAALDDEILALCSPVWSLDLPVQEGTVDDYRKLVNELMRLMLAQQLFTFVTTADAKTPAGQVLAVPGTNNESERTLRPSAEARNTGRTNKTLRGARRRTVNLSVLESLRQFLPEFTLHSVVAEVSRWTERGESCFTTLLKRLKLKVPARSVLDQLLPLPSD